MTSFSTNVEKGENAIMIKRRYTKNKNRIFNEIFTNILQFTFMGYKTDKLTFYSGKV